MTDFTKSTKAVDPQGNVATVKFKRDDKSDLPFLFTIETGSLTTDGGCVYKAGENIWFNADGTSEGIKLLPPVDWTAPIVAVHTETGERVDLELGRPQPDSNGHYLTAYVQGIWCFWEADGFPADQDNPYRIENRPAEEQGPSEARIKQACELGGKDYGDYSRGVYFPETNVQILAHARTLEQYAPELVDPVLDAIEEGVSQAYDRASGSWPGTVPITEAIMAVLKERGIELGEAK